MSEIHKINSKITSINLVRGDAERVDLHEGVSRPDMLHGTTYKLKSPVYDHAIYITINDIVLNEGTPEEVRRPFEIFINSKNMANFMWVTALTRILSAVFRKGGGLDFLAEEMQCIFDPKGGYWKKGKYYNSIVAEIGGVVENHLIRLGLVSKEDALSGDAIEHAPKSAMGEICPKCQSPTVIRAEGCNRCLNCDYSECG